MEHPIRCQPWLLLLLVVVVGRAFTVKIHSDQGFGIAVITIRVGVMQGEPRTLPAATTGQPYTAQLKGAILAPGDSVTSTYTLEVLSN